MTSSAEKTHVHVVEDDPAVRSALCMVLADEGYGVSPWENGDQFIGQARVVPSDLVLLDLAMPGMSGAEVAAAMRVRGDDAKTIVVSGMRRQDFDRAIAAISPSAALRKPLDKERLIAAIESCAQPS